MGLILYRSLSMKYSKEARRATGRYSSLAWLICDSFRLASWTLTFEQVEKFVKSCDYKASQN